MRFSRSSNPLRNQRKSLLSTAAEGLRQDAATPWAGAGFSSAADKGAARTIPDGKLIHSPGTRETECAREHWVSPTEYKPSVSGNNQLSVKETRRGAHARATVTFFRTLRIEHRRVQKVLLPARQNQGERLLVLQ